MSNIVAGGLFGNGSGNLLSLTGSSVPGPKMNRWLAVPVTLTNSTYVGMEFKMSATGNTDPSELFFGFHNNPVTNSAPWSAYVAVKHPNNGNPAGIEGTGSGGILTNAGVVLNTDLLVGALFHVNASNILDGISVWLNPTIGMNGLPTNAPDHTWSVTGTLDITAQTLLKIRAQNMPTLIDNISIITVPEPSTYAAILGLLAIGLVAWRRRK